MAPALVRRCRSAFVVAGLLLAPAAGGRAGAGDTVEYPVKAAFLFNFARFVSWPADALASSSQVAICVLGADPFGDALDEAVAGKRVEGRPLKVRRFAGLEELEPCPVLFVSASEERHLPAILERLKGAPVLTVGNSAEFARRGGVIGFYLEGNKVRFEIDPAAAGRVGLKVSAKLLSVARVSPGPRKRDS
jgi:uncharacterized protein DUF4154